MLVIEPIPIPIGLTADDEPNSFFHTNSSRSIRGYGPPDEIMTGVGFLAPTMLRSSKVSILYLDVLSSASPVLHPVDGRDRANIIAQPGAP
jgi:hypothetical protein